MQRRRRFGTLVLLALLGVAILVALALMLPLPEEVRFAMALAPGWNLANAMDAYGLGADAGSPAAYETYWGAEPITPAMLAAIAQAGFHTVRLPVTWFEHIDSSGQIDPAWLNRVQRIVDDALAAGLNVIVNAHHDAWYTPSPENLAVAEATLRMLWGQIAARFAAYDTRLLFEGMNEPRLIGTAQEWTSGTPEARDVINRLNAAFVETVRASGSMNAERYLLIPAYAASVQEDALAALRLPADARVMVSAHLYAPYDFALNASGTASWSPATEADTAELRAAIHRLYWHFIRRGVPVVITEFGAVDKQNTDDRASWAATVTALAKQAHIPCIWWDTSLLAQKTLTWRYPQLLAALVR